MSFAHDAEANAAATPRDLLPMPEMDSSDEIKTVELQHDRFGKIQVHIQGQLLAEGSKRAVFLTLHDVGRNHATFVDFVQHPVMSEIRARSTFVHVTLPGQEREAKDLDQDGFPSMMDLGEEFLPFVLDQLHVSLVVGIGEGAGANILARFALKHHQRVLGLVLVHLVTQGVGIMEKLRDSLAPRAGRRLSQVSEDQKDQQVDVPAEARLQLNGRNLRKFFAAYVQRKDISSDLTRLKTLDVLLVSGQRSPYVNGVDQLYGRMDKSKTQLLKVDGVADPLAEAPEKVAQSLLLFVKGLGFLTAIPEPGNLRSLGAIGRRRTLSMEEYDVPRRLSLSK